MATANLSPNDLDRLDDALTALLKSTRRHTTELDGAVRTVASGSLRALREAREALDKAAMECEAAMVLARAVTP